MKGPGHVLRVGNRTIYRGEPTAISEALFVRLSRDPSLRLEEVAPLFTPDPEPAPPADMAASDSAPEGEEESDS